MFGHVFLEMLALLGCILLGGGILLSIIIIGGLSYFIGKSIRKTIKEDDKNDLS